MSVIDDQRGVVTLCSCSVTLSNVYNVAAEEKFFPFFRCRLDSGFLFILFSSLIMYPLLHGIGYCYSRRYVFLSQARTSGWFDLALALVLFLPRTMFAVLAVVDNLVVTVMGQKVQRVRKWIRRGEAWRVISTDINNNK